jgi:hypothetical protein
MYCHAKQIQFEAININISEHSLYHAGREIGHKEGMVRTFCAVDDTALINLIQGATKRIILIAPGVYEPVAKALENCFRESNSLDITVILDPDENVCRIGYGDVKGLQLLNELAEKNGFKVRNQPGLRLGVMLADEEMMVWSPTPRSVEAPPSSDTHQPPDGSVQPLAPNGLFLGMNPGKQVADAIAAEGTDSGAGSAEIGKAAVTAEQVRETVTALKNNPPVPVDLARITLVFSTKLQFVELTVKGANISRSQLKVSSALLNADVKGDLKELIESKLHAFAVLRDTEITVPAFHDGEPVYDKSGVRREEAVSESSLLRLRNTIEGRFIYDITGYGRLIEKDKKAQFENQVEAFKEQLLAHSKGIRKLLDKQATQILDDAIKLIEMRMGHSEESGAKSKIMMNTVKLRKELQNGIEKAKTELPVITLVFKDVTYEQTQDADFRDRVRKSLPDAVHKRLGDWDKHLKVAEVTHQPQ